MNEKHTLLSLKVYPHSQRFNITNFTIIFLCKYNLLHGIDTRICYHDINNFINNQIGKNDKNVQLE